MNSKAVKEAKLLIVFVLGIWVSFSPVFITNINLRENYQDNSLEYSHHVNLDRINPKISVISDKIHIDSNWTAAKAAGICTGSGNFTDPYVIENLYIDANYLDNCIKIQNSDAFFRIENCSLSNSNEEYGYAGINIINCQNGVLVNNFCTNNRCGIIIDYSSNFSIINNDCAYNEVAGIALYYCSNITVISNECYNAGVGIWLDGDNIQIINNICYNNLVGFNFLGSNNKIIGNICSYNSNWGILIRAGNNNYISQNECFYAEIGLYLFGISHELSSNHSVIDNKCKLNEIGIRMEGVINSSILNNDIETSVYHGIILVNSSRNTITRNIVDVHGQYGISLNADSNGNDIYLNCVTSPLSAYDHGSNNKWDNGIKGNFWSNYTGLDENNDGIGDVPYNISGSAGSQDRFPLMKCPYSLKETEEIPIGLIISIVSICGGATIISALLLLDRRKKRKLK